MNISGIFKIKGISIAGFILFSNLTFAFQEIKKPVDYVNPYIGNISHLLVPAYPTIHLPNSLLRICPERGDFTGDLIKRLQCLGSKPQDFRLSEELIK